MSKDVVDLFTEEVNKISLEEEKKMAKRIAKEKKREKKKEKKLEKQEDIEFAKKLEEKKSIQEEPIVKEKHEENTKQFDTRVLRELNKRELNDFDNTEKHPFLNFLLGLSIIILLLSSGAYAIFNIIKGKDLETILTSSALCGLSLFYILSIIINKKGIKKFFEILATLCIAGYMCYYLFIA